MDVLRGMLSSEKNNIINWIRGYFRNNADNDTKAVIGISGGKDSTIAAALCVAALGKERVAGVLMPQGKQSDIDVSYAVCRHLGIEHSEININKAVQGLYAAIPFNINDVATMNTPARIRMATLYAIAAAVNGRVVNTCNASEIYVGWGTKFGDNVGDFSPLAEFTVTEVKAIGYELGLPVEFVEKLPIDGLCGKSDESALGFSYEILDKYIKTGVCENIDIKERIEMLHRQSAHKRNPIPTYRREV